MVKLNYIAIGLIVIVFFGCKKNKCLHSYGSQKTEVRTVDFFNQISVEDDIDIILTPDSGNTLTITSGANMLPYIISEVKNNTLIIRNDNKCRFLRSFKKKTTVILPAKTLQKIEHFGSGNISTTDTLKLPTLKLEIDDGSGSYNLTVICDSVFLLQHTGTADFTLSGKTNYLYTYTAANGWFWLGNLFANNVHINHAGTGDVIVNAQNTLLIELYLSGNVQYYGNPIVIVSAHTGSGKIEHLP